MRFSLSNLLLLVTLVAVGIGWWLDHNRLVQANTRLNTEAAELFSSVAWRGSTISPLQFPNGKFPPQRSYNFSLPEDRAEYRKTYGTGPFGQFLH